MEEISTLTTYDSLLWTNTNINLQNLSNRTLTIRDSLPWNDTAIFQDISTTMFTNLTSANRTTINSSISAFYPIIVTEMVISIICLILSIIVYSILPEFKNVHGKNLISLSSCLLITYFLLCIDIKLRHHVPYSLCFVVAVITHVTFLATFFWTNVMAFDIWSNITSIKSRREVRGRSRKYFKYSIYAWTATLLTALPAIVLESTEFVPLKYRPQFGVKRCWLSGTTAFIYYFNLPVGVILFGNLVMFVMTIWRLWMLKKMTAILPVKQQQKRLHLYLKLFFVMGIIWITEFLPWATKIYNLYALAGMMTALHGVLLFVIFVLKKKILRQIRDLVSGKSALKKWSTSNQTYSSSVQQFTSQSHTDA